MVVPSERTATMIRESGRGQAMNESLKTALDVLAKWGGRLADPYKLPWSSSAHQAALSLRWNLCTPKRMAIAAIVGGASSGKSTVFNNLLGGHEVSQITARGHSTRGPILAVHEDHRDDIEAMINAGRLFPGWRSTYAGLDARAAGEPDLLTIVGHTIMELRDVLLMDTPDFTSEAALAEGDVTLNLLPWFDLLLIVQDPERWFDRQSVSQLREVSLRYGQRRFVIFNRTREENLADTDAARLRAQSERMRAEAMSILEFRRGRGFCRFPPGALSETRAFLHCERIERDGPLLRVVSSAANEVLNQNNERRRRRTLLGEALDAVLARSMPTERDCMIALMTPDERRQLEVVWRMLRASDAREWFSAQARRLRKLVGQTPVLGSMFAGASDAAETDRQPADRAMTALSYFESTLSHLQNEITRVTRSSHFWREVEAWTGQTPSFRPFALDDDVRETIVDSGRRFDGALQRWNAQIESECEGLSTHLKVGIGAGIIGLAVVLIAVPGPITALTFVAAKGAIGTALAELAAASGAAALLGRPIGRFVEVLREKTLGSPEFTEVQSTAKAFRQEIENAGRTLLDQALAEADALILPEKSDLSQALRMLREADVP